MNKKLITVKEIVNKFNITFQTVNHYTNLGLLSVVTKKGNVRLYGETEVRERLAQITRLVSEGYSLGLIRKKLVGLRSI
ncbi:MAG: MerR family transcriptional regulator [Candidatus Omnitrophota bacterium]